MNTDISVFVKSMDERKEELRIKPTDSISVLKDLVHDKFNIEKNEMFLLFRGRKLEDEQTVASCKIADKDTVLLVKKVTPSPSPSDQPFTSTANRSEDYPASLNSIVGDGIREMDLIIPYVNRYSYSFINSFGERVSDDSSPLREACVENMKRVLPYINTMITNLQSLYTELSNHVSDSSTNPYFSRSQIHNFVYYITALVQYMNHLYNTCICFSFIENLESLQGSGTDITLDSVVQNMFQADPLGRAALNRGEDVSRLRVPNISQERHEVRQNESTVSPQDHEPQNTVRLIVNLSNEEGDSQVSEMVERFLQNLTQALGGGNQPTTRQSQPTMTQQQADSLLDEVLAETLPETHRGVKRSNTNIEEPSKRRK